MGKVFDRARRGLSVQRVWSGNGPGTQAFSRIGILFQRALLEITQDSPFSVAVRDRVRAQIGTGPQIRARGAIAVASMPGTVPE